MTGPRLKQLLFPEAEQGKGKKWNINAFAKFAGIDRQLMNSRFKSRNVSIDILKKYAQWKGIEESKFLQYATGPAPDYEPAEPATAAVTEPEPYYHTNLSSTPINQTDMQLTINVVMKLIEVQKEQNVALIKLANAAEINAITIAKLNGINHADIHEKKAG